MKKILLGPWLAKSINQYSVKEKPDYYRPIVGKHFIMHNGRDYTIGDPLIYYSDDEGGYTYGYPHHLVDINPQILQIGVDKFLINRDFARGENSEGWEDIYFEFVSKEKYDQYLLLQ